MTVAFAVAYRADDPQRIQNWRWVKAQLEATFPTWAIFEEPGDRPHWNKQRALNHAIARAAAVAEIVILYDSDCFMPAAKLRRLVTLALGSSRWAIPTRTVRLTRAATRRTLAGEQLPALSPSDYALIHPFQENTFAEVPIPIVEPLGVIQTAVLQEVGVFDDSPWTYQEWWAGMALETLVGPPATLDVDVFHLWHPARVGGGDRIGLRRLMQYELAYQDREAMRELVAGEDLLEEDLARLMKRWRIQYVKGPHDADRLDVVCSALMTMRPANAVVRA